MPQIDRFGFLPYKESFKFLDYEIIPENDFDENFNFIKKYTNRDGFYYPPIEYSVAVDIKSGKQKRIPNSKRPSHLHDLPPSHLIVSPDSKLKLTEARDGISGFIINSLAYLLGFRLQFFNWWFDMRIPLESQNYVLVTKNNVEEFLGNAIQQWEKWNNYQKKLFKNLLFMHSRNSSYLWDWERFMMEYAVFDACWKFHCLASCSIKRPPHEKRLEIILTAFNMQIHSKEIKAIIDLRTNLFHEGLWDNGQPCTGRSSEAFMSYYTLKRINHCLIAALLNYKTDYIKTDWRHMGQFLFAKSKGWVFSHTPLKKDMR